MSPVEGIFVVWLCGFLFSCGQKSVVLKGMTLGLFKTAQLTRLMIAMTLDAIIWPYTIPRWLFSTQDQLNEHRDELEMTGMLFQPIEPIYPEPSLPAIDAEFGVEVYEVEIPPNPRRPVCPHCGEGLELNNLRWESMNDDTP